MAHELTAKLCAMGDSDAGAALKAAFAYLAGRDNPSLSTVAQSAVNDWRWLIDLSHKRTIAGKSGSAAGGETTRFAPGKRNFAPSKPVFAPDKSDFAPSKPPPAPEINILDGLEAFL
jgi:hypothetical protein